MYIIELGRVMASGTGTISRSSSFNSFKCCKSKPFIHYVCVKCLNIFHKNCIPRFKRDINFIKDNKIICCNDADESNSSDQDDEKSILEKTINELNSDSEQKSKYIQKLKIENQQFIQEAMKAEDEMIEQIKNQESLIRNLQDMIKELKKKSDSINKPSKNIGTQTNNISKNVLSLIDKKSKETSAVDKTKYKDTGTQYENKSITNETQINAVNLNTNRSKHIKITSNIIIRKDDSQPNKKLCQTKQILILADENGKHLNQAMRCMPELKEYNILTVCKPSAMHSQVLENIEKLTLDFTPNDFVVIIAGLNDIKNKTYPSFRNLCDKLKLCVHTNVIMSSVPYGYNKQLDKNIFKFNKKLREFLQRFKRLSENNVSFLEINHLKSRSVNKYSVVYKIINKIEHIKFVNNNLTYISTNRNIVTSSSASQNLNTEEEKLANHDGNSLIDLSACDTGMVVDLTTHDSNLINNENSHSVDQSNHEGLQSNFIEENENAQDFLYPRLSQLKI